jgi:hypothetical protein
MIIVIADLRSFLAVAGALGFFRQAALGDGQASRY